MNVKVMFAALVIAPGLAGCLQQNTQPQGLQSAQQVSGSAPCAPSNTSALISTGRSLLDLTHTLLETQQNLSGDSSSYARRVQAAENAQQLNQGQNTLNNVEKLAGLTGVNEPCVADSSATGTVTR